MEPLTRLTDALAGRELLLVLDNCEHLIGAAADVADAVLRGAPGLRLLATSREPLGIAGEQLWPVEPLALPRPRAQAASFPAVRLLLDRAVAARPGFTLDPRTTGPVVRICRALDGMPLAIELAAARLRTLPVDVLAGRLADRFRLLTNGSRTALPRHQTLRAVVDWSWDLLDDDERALWRRFAVFHGGADVTAVEQVCGADVDLLGALVDKSLLVLAGDRYRMLETIREYGLERLAEAGETEQLRVAHARYLLALAGAAEPELRRGDQLSWLRRLAVEHDNLHAAVRAAVAAGDARTATALTARLGLVLVAARAPRRGLRAGPGGAGAHRGERAGGPGAGLHVLRAERARGRRDDGRGQGVVPGGPSRPAPARTPGTRCCACSDRSRRSSSPGGWCSAWNSSSRCSPTRTPGCGRSPR
ncbi:hypothetical protein GCM10020358_70110 [Amorphoplanes nipponensis]|uniref:ATP-binding protein n=1 Tax=Actinoplanes nipponensis TaxID=135950 RepID=UPI0031EED599